MSSGKSRAVPPLEPKRCALCGEAVSERRPQFLLQLVNGEIVGPYHSGCAYKLANAYWRGEATQEAIERGASWYGSAAREETLPW